MQSANTNIRFETVETAPLADIEELEPASNNRTITHDVVTGVTTTQIIDNYGKNHQKRYDLITHEYCEENYSVNADDPRSAKASCYWVQGLERKGWKVHTETQTTLTSDKAFFYIEASLKAFEKDTLVFERIWHEKVKRYLL